MKTHFFKTIIVCVIWATVLPGYSRQSKESIYVGIEFDMPRVKKTSFPDFNRSIIGFGAVGDGFSKILRDSKQQSRLYMHKRKSYRSKRSLDDWADYPTEQYQSSFGRWCIDSI